MLIQFFLGAKSGPFGEIPVQPRGRGQAGVGWYEKRSREIMLFIGKLKGRSKMISNV